MQKEEKVLSKMQVRGWIGGCCAEWAGGSSAGWHREWQSEGAKGAAACCHCGDPLHEPYGCSSVRPPVRQTAVLEAGSSARFAL